MNVEEKTLIAYGNYTEIAVTQFDIDSICVSGSNDEQVADFVERNKGQLQKLNPDSIRKELEDYGAWTDSELQDEDQNLHRLVWTLVWNLFENINEE